jgi:Phage tail protein (Tail_P2_I)
VSLILQQRPIPYADPPTDLLPDSFAADLYESLAPLARQDFYYGWALLILCNTIGTMYQLVDAIVRDQPEGPGWSLVLDVNRCPPEALGWLAQFNGVRLGYALSDAEQRQAIQDASGFRRGTPAAMTAAIQATLTGTKTVTLHERDGDPYSLTILTAAEETPDLTKTRTAMLSQKPAGIVASINGVGVTQTWATFQTKAADWAGEITVYGTWSNSLWNVPM